MKKIAVLLATGFEEIEALSVVDVLRRAGFSCDIVSVMDEIEVTSSHGITIKADKFFDDDMLIYDMIVLPGGMPGAEYLANDNRVIKLLQAFNQDNEKYIAAICAAPMALAKANITKGKRVTSFPDEKFSSLFADANYLDELVVVDDNLITSRGPATTLLFAYTLVEVLGEKSEALEEEMLFTMLKKNLQDD